LCERPTVREGETLKLGGRGGLAGQVLRVVEAKKVVTWRFYLTKIMPIGFFMAATLHFGNLVYLHLTVAFIQMLKASRRPRPPHFRPIPEAVIQVADWLRW